MSKECCRCCYYHKDRENNKDHERYHKYWDPVYEQLLKETKKGGAK